MRESRMSRRALLRASARAGIGAAGLALVGCGGDDDAAPDTARQAAADAAGQEDASTTAPRDATPGSASAGAAARGEDDRGDGRQQQAAAPSDGAEIATGLRAGLQLNPTSLDPHAGTGEADAHFFQLFHDYLVMHDADSAPQAGISLAASWEMPEPQGLRIIFNLRDGVAFHNGDDFTSEDVRLNLERVATHPDSVLKEEFSIVEAVGAPDRLTAAFSFSEPSAAVMHRLGERGGAIVNVREADALGGRYGLQPVGTGPYRFSEWVERRHVAGARNPDHWMTGPVPGIAAGPRVPYFDDARFRIFSDGRAMAGAALSGELDLCQIPDPGLIAEFEDDPEWDVVSFEGAFVGEVLWMNSSKRPFDNINLRLAVMHALHPEAVNRTVHGGRMIPALGGQWPVGTWVYEEVPRNPQAAYPEIEARRARAREYFELSGLTAEQVNAAGGLKFATGAEQAKIDAGLIYAQQIKDVLGLDATLDPLDLAALIPAMAENGEYHFALTSWSRHAEPDGIASPAYTSTGLYNPNGRQGEFQPIHPELDDLIRQARQAFEIDQRRAFYRRINEIIVGEGHFYSMLYGVNFTAVRNGIQNARETLFNAEGNWQTRWLHRNGT